MIIYHAMNYIIHVWPVGREYVAKLMNLKNDVDKGLNTTHSHILIAINTNIERL